MINDSLNDLISTKSCSGDEEEDEYEVEHSDADVENLRYGRRHWQQPDEPKAMVKKEKVRFDFGRLILSFFL